MKEGNFGLYWQNKCIDEIVLTDNPLAAKKKMDLEYANVTIELGSGKEHLNGRGKDYHAFMEKKWKVVYENLYKK